MGVLVSVVDDPLIPVIRDDNQRALLSLRNVFTESETLRGFAPIDAATEVVLLRLCATVLARALTVGEDAEGDEYRQREILNHAWNTPPAQIVAKVHDYLGHWSHRMILNDPTRPFLQHPDLEVKNKNLVYLRVRILERSYSPETLETHKAFQAMIRQLHFDPGGVHATVGDSSAQESLKMCPGLTAQSFFLMGKNLFQTVLANVNTAMVGDPDDKPLWELDDADCPNVRGQGGAGVIGPNGFNFSAHRSMKLTFSDDATQVIAFACVGDPAKKKTYNPDLAVKYDPYCARATTLNRHGEESEITPRNSNPSGILDVLAALDTHKLNDGTIPRPAPVFASLLSLEVGKTSVLKDLAVVVVSTKNKMGSKVLDVVRETIKFDLRVSDESHIDVREVVLAAFSDMRRAVSLYRGFLWEIHLGRCPSRKVSSRSAPEVAFSHAISTVLREWLASLDADTPASEAAALWEAKSTRFLEEHSRLFLLSLPDEAMAIKQATHTETSAKHNISAPSARLKLISKYRNEFLTNVSEPEDPSEGTQWDELPNDEFVDDDEEEQP